MCIVSYFPLHGERILVVCMMAQYGRLFFTAISRSFVLGRAGKAHVGKRLIYPPQYDTIILYASGRITQLENPTLTELKLVFS